MAAMSASSVSTVVGDHHTVVRLTGDLGVEVLPELSERLRPLAKRETALVLDLGGVQFCGSGALELFVELQHALTAAGGSMEMTSVPHAVQRLLKLTDLDEFFHVTGA